MRWYKSLIPFYFSVKIMNILIQALWLLSDRPSQLGLTNSGISWLLCKSSGASGSRQGLRGPISGIGSFCPVGMMVTQLESGATGP